MTAPTSTPAVAPRTGADPGGLTATQARPTTRASGTPRTQVGDTVLVLLGEGVRRPMIVSVAGMVPIYTSSSPTVPARQEFRVSGMIVCEPEDHTLPVLRGSLDKPGDPARCSGRPDRSLPLAYGECLAEGTGLGQWIPRRGAER